MLTLLLKWGWLGSHRKHINHSNFSYCADVGTYTPVMCVIKHENVSATQWPITHTTRVQYLFVASICIGAFWYKHPSFHTHVLYYYYYHYYCCCCCYCCCCWLCLQVWHWWNTSWIGSNVWEFSLLMKCFWKSTEKYFTLYHTIFCVSMQSRHMLKGNLLLKQLQCYAREVVLLKYFLKCGQRQDIEQFQHHIHNHLRVNFVMGHHCPPQRSSLPTLCNQSTVSAKATSTSRTEVLESCAG